MYRNEADAAADRLLAEAIGRLRTFRGRWDADGMIDDVGGLTAADLDVVLMAAATSTTAIVADASSNPDIGPLTY